MHWVLESGFEDFGYQWLIKVLQRYDIPHTFVKVIPQKNIITSPDFDTFAADATEADNIHINAENIFPFGSMGLSRIATERNWRIGSLFNDQFTFENWSQGFGLDNLLNSGSIIQKVSDPLPPSLDTMFFARPCEDNKAFSGRVFMQEQFLDWQEKVLKINDTRSKLHANTMITLAPFKRIFSEARVFVVDGKVITGSYYKIGDGVEYKEVKHGDPVLEYTQGAIKDYQPARAFVIDIALTEDGYSIIEINNINSVGLYHADADKFVQAIMNAFN
jgi:hypothetical protein